MEKKLPFNWEEKVFLQKTGRKIFFLSLVLSALFFSVQSEAAINKEYQVKAAFLYNFAKFIEWPPATYKEGEFKICLVGSDKFGAALDPIENKSIKNMPIKLSRNVNISAVKKCNIVYLNGGSIGTAANVVEDIGSLPILTVSDIDDFTSNGGMIEFINDDGKIKFKINSSAANDVGLKISAKLLELAQ